MSARYLIVHAEWCPHCVTLLDTMKTLGGNPSKTGEYNVNGTIVRAIEQKELNNPEIKAILGNRHIAGFPTILIKNNNSFNEYNGSRDIESLRQLFSKPKKSKKFSKKQRKVRERKVRESKTKKRNKSTRKTRKTRKPKSTSWLLISVLCCCKVKW